MYKRASILLLLGFTGLIASYTSQEGYNLALKFDNKILGGELKVTDKIDRLVFELDIRRIFRGIYLADSDYIDLKFSRGDMEYLQKSKDEAIQKGFIIDNNNPWRTGEILLDKDLVKLKFKLHGTSASPLKRGGISLRLKHKNEPPYFLNMRDFKLITAFDEADISTVVINNLANNIGLISVKRDFKILRVNGNDLGLYQLEEHHSKEWFERNSKLTNYTIIKSNDDWDRKEVDAHISNTDLWIENKEFKTSSDNPEIALGALENLLLSVRTESIEDIKNLIDLDYWAKFVAFFSIVNNNHPITGDNLKYIYDHTKGNFLVLFRLEDQIYRIENDVEEFSHSWFQSPIEYEGSDTHKLFRLLLRDSEFINKRNQYLQEIIEKKDELIKIANNIHDENFDLIIYNSNFIPRHKIVHEKKVFFFDLENNFNVANSYLNYQKAFITSEYSNGTSVVEVINDSFQDLLIESITIQSPGINDENIEDNEIKKHSMNILLKQSELDNDFKQMVKKQTIFVDKKGLIKDFEIRNLTTGKKLKKNDIYFNNKKKVRFFSLEESLSSLKYNDVSYVSDGSNQITIKSGNYIISKSIVLPDNYLIEIEPGTTFRLKEGVSFFVKGDFIAVGSPKSPINFFAENPLKPFGVLAIIGREEPVKVNMEYVKVSGGSEATIEGIRFLGQLSVHNSTFFADQITLSDSFSDDGGNIRNSNVEIKNSRFINNKFDQLDLDFCRGNLGRSFFQGSIQNESIDIEPNGDGIDLSGSFMVLSENKFTNFKDKGASIGEESIALFLGNEFDNNNKAVAVKDGSRAFISSNNEFIRNVEDFSIYIKKPFYDEPQIFIDASEVKYNYSLVEGKLNNVKPSELESIFYSYENE